MLDLADRLPSESRRAESLNENAVAEAVGTVLVISADEAAEHSRRCFEELKASLDLRILDYCLAFDEGVVIWYPAIAEQRTGIAYFSPLVRQSRHAAALSQFFGNRLEGEGRRSAIEAAALTDLAQRLPLPPRRGAPPVGQR